MKWTNKVCWSGFKQGECPKRRLENEKLIYGILLVIAVGILVVCNMR